MRLQVGDKVRITPDHPFIGVKDKYDGNRQGEVIARGTISLWGGGVAPTVVVKWPDGEGYVIWTYVEGSLVKVDELVYEDREVL